MSGGNYFSARRKTQVLHEFVGYRSIGLKYDEANELVNGSIVWLAHLDALVGNAVNCLTKERNLRYASPEAFI